MGSKFIGYIRSSENQNFTFQEQALKNAGCSRIFIDVTAESNSERTEFNKCLECLRDGKDTLVVWKSTEIGKSTVELLRIVGGLRKRDIGFKSVSEELFDTTGSNGHLISDIFALLAEHETERIRKRTKTGLTAAKARGRMGGRPKIFQGERKKLVQAALINHSNNIREIAGAFHVSVSTIYRIQKEMMTESHKYKNN